MLDYIRSYHGTILLCCLGLVGCDAGHQQTVRSKGPEDPTAWSGSPISDRSESSNEGNSGGGKGFFKSTRLPGGLSSESSEIERSLGVGR